MSDWSLDQVFNSLHSDIQAQLNTARETFGHPVAKGDVSENVWLELFNEYLPARYKAEKAFVVDSNNVFSQQIDVVIFDQQYTPFIFKFLGQVIVPAESVYAIFETKQSVNADNVKYAQDKVASVRQLHRTSLPIPHAGGTYPPKPLIPILGGILTLDSEWNPPMGDALLKNLKNGKGEKTLNLGCIAKYGIFKRHEDQSEYEMIQSERAATRFIFELITLLQFSGTVPMIDIGAYSKWL